MISDKRRELKGQSTTVTPANQSEESLWDPGLQWPN